MSDGNHPLETRTPAKYLVVDATIEAPGQFADTPSEAMNIAHELARKTPGNFIDIYHHSFTVCCREEPKSEDGDGVQAETAG